MYTTTGSIRNCMHIFILHILSISLAYFEAEIDKIKSISEAEPNLPDAYKKKSV